MHRPPSRTGQRRKSIKRKFSRPGAIALGLAGLVLIASFGANLEANEVQAFRRSGDVGQFPPIAIASLPAHRSLVASAVQAPRETAPRSSKLENSELNDTPVAPQSIPGLTASPPPGASRPVEPFAISSGLSVIDGKLSRGESLSTLLRARGVSPQMVRTIDRRIRSEFDFRKAQPGDSFRLTRDHNGELVSFRYRSAPDEIIVMRRSGSGYQVKRETLPLKPRLTRMQGTVESSLYRSIRGLGHDPVLANAFADIFAWEIDFTRQLKPGDGFTILYERLYREEDGSKVYVRPGRILAAQFKGWVGEHTAVYFEEENGIGSYFRPDGDTLEAEFLAAPLKFSRISSNYSAARSHPILKVVRPHHGIDYAARVGTPLWSVADGTVISLGVNGGFGNLIKIRHANGYVSYYAHLSAFGPNLRVGQKVKQKQVIGYVGQTGLATGPHVCFRMTKYGKYVNPTSLNHDKPTHRSVADAFWADFEIVRDQLLANLREGRPTEFAGNAL